MGTISIIHWGSTKNPQPLNATAENRMVLKATAFTGRWQSLPQGFQWQQDNTQACWAMPKTLETELGTPEEKPCIHIPRKLLFCLNPFPYFCLNSIFLSFTPKEEKASIKFFLACFIKAAQHSVLIPFSCLLKPFHSFHLVFISSILQEIKRNHFPGIIHGNEVQVRAAGITAAELKIMHGAKGVLLLSM